MTSHSIEKRIMLNFYPYYFSLGSFIVFLIRFMSIHNFFVNIISFY